MLLPDWSPRKSLLVLVGLLLALEMGLYRDFLFGDAAFVFKDLGDDSYTYSYPQMTYLLRVLGRGELPQWSFHNGLGQNTWPFSLYPVATPLLLAFFRHDVAGGMLWTQLVTTFLAGLSVFAWLWSRQLHGLACVAAAGLYAGCGYVLAAGSWFLFGFSEIYLELPLLLLAVEHYLVRGRWVPVALVVGVVFIGQPVHGYFAALVVGGYLLLRWAEANFAEPGRWLRRVGVLAGAGALGVGLAGFLLLSNLHHMLQSPRGSGEFAPSAVLRQHPLWQPASAAELGTAVLRLFGNNLQGPPDAYTGWYNYFEAPAYYCGLLGLLLVPQLLGGLARRARLAYGGLLAGCALVALLPAVRYALWLYVGNYYRVAALLPVLLVLLGSAQALSKLLRAGPLYPKTLLASLAGALALLWLVRGHLSPDASSSVGVIGFFLAAYAALLGGRRYPAVQRWFGALLLGGIGLELLLVAAPVLSERKVATRAELQGPGGYHDATWQALAAIARTDSSFYRIEKDYYSGSSRTYSYNEAQVQNFRGSRAYGPFNNGHYVHFLASVQALRPTSEPATRWLAGIGRQPAVLRLCGVRYLLSNHDSTDQYRAWGYRPVGQVGTVTILRTRAALPLGSTFGRYLTEAAFACLDSSARQRALLQAVVVPARLVPALGGMQLFDPATRPDSLPAPADTLQLTSFTDRDLRGTLRLPRQKILFFAIPYDAGWALQANNEPVPLEPVFNGLLGAVLPPGRYAIHLRYQDPYLRRGTLLSLGSLALLLGAAGWSRRTRRALPLA